MNTEYDYYKKNKFSSFSNYVGWIIGAAGLIISILSLVKTNKPQFEYDVISSTRFINNHESTSYIRILIDSLDIQENHLNISAINIRIKNKGTEDIRYDDYDKGFFGLSLINGSLLESPIVVEASSDYIKNKLSTANPLTDSTKVAIPTISLDVDDYYIIRLIVLHDVNKNPKFIANGKIVGQKDIKVNFIETNTSGFWERTFGGNWLIQVVRLFAYLIFIIALLSVVIYFLEKIDEWKDSRKRKRLIKKISTRSDILPFVKEDFIKKGMLFILEVNDIYKRSEDDVTKKYIKSKAFLNSSSAIQSNNRSAIRLHSERYKNYSYMIERGYILLKNDTSIAFNKDAKASVQAIYSMLLSEGIFYRYKTRLVGGYNTSMDV